MDGTKDHVKWSKSDWKWQISHVFSPMQNLDFEKKTWK
jgi:hypothetical protein